MAGRRTPTREEQREGGAGREHMAIGWDTRRAWGHPEKAPPYRKMKRCGNGGRRKRGKKGGKKRCEWRSREDTEGRRTEKEAKGGKRLRAFAFFGAMRGGK